MTDDWLNDPHWECLDCGLHTGLLCEYYMVEDKLWATAVPDREGMLCVLCLESRLGRLLVPSDFKNVPLNKSNSWLRSETLENRLGISC